jgi:hypothetical protein
VFFKIIVTLCLYIKLRFIRREDVFIQHLIIGYEGVALHVLEEHVSAKFNRYLRHDDVGFHSAEGQMIKALGKTTA